MKTSHASSSVEGSPHVRTISDDSISENNQWVLGWMEYRHGRHQLNARALAISVRPMHYRPS
eukprot:6057137-Pyramimonas_sp.AAC.1